MFKNVPRLLFCLYEAQHLKTNAIKLFDEIIVNMSTAA